MSSCLKLYVRSMPSASSPPASSGSSHADTCGAKRVSTTAVSATVQSVCPPLQCRPWCKPCVHHCSVGHGAKRVSTTAVLATVQTVCPPLQCRPRCKPCVHHCSVGHRANHVSTTAVSATVQTVCPLHTMLLQTQKQEQRPLAPRHPPSQICRKRAGVAPSQPSPEHRARPSRHAAAALSVFCP
eukprot:363880-Chlamydomonas_euryale.AAC.7